MDVTQALDYPRLFRQHIHNALAAVLADVRAGKTNGRETENAPARAVEILDFALKLVSAWSPTRDLLLALSPHMERRGYWSEWLPYLDAGRQLAEASGDWRAYAALSMWMGVIKRSLGDYGKARHYLEISAKQFSELGEPYQYAVVQNRLAWTERLAGNTNVAQSLAAQACELLAREADDPELEQARSLSILGSIAYDRNEWAQAEAYYRQALEILSPGSDIPRHAWGHIDLGLALTAQGRYEEAVLHYQSAQRLLELIHSPVQTAVLQLNLSLVYMSLDKPAAVLAECAEAHKIFERLGDQRRLIMIETNRGMAYRRLEQFDEATAALIAAKQRAETLHHHELLVNVLEQLGQVYTDQRNYAEAVATLKSALVRLDKVDHSPRYESYRTRLLKRLQEIDSVIDWV